MSTRGPLRSTGGRLRWSGWNRQGRRFGLAPTSPNISDIDLLQDQFSVEMLLWTTWAGDPQADPSDQLMILNGIYDGDIQRFERVIADGSYQRLVEEAIMTPLLGRQLKLRSRRILVLQNPEVVDVLADVNPAHWVVPWNDLLSGKITSGNDLCSSSGLKRLCVN